MANKKQRWHRWDEQPLRDAQGREIPRGAIYVRRGEVLINDSIPASWSDADLVRMIAERLNVRVDAFPPGFARVHLRDRIYSASSTQVLNEIVRNYGDLYWRISDGVLEFSFRIPGVPPDPFIEAVVVLMSKARRVNGRIPGEVYEGSILVELDKQGFVLRERLPVRFRKQLTDWNRKHSRNPDLQVRSFTDGWKVHYPPKYDLRRGIEQKLARTFAKYQKQRTSDSSSANPSSDL
jgi:hypothetical protein